MTVILASLSGFKPSYIEKEQRPKEERVDRGPILPLILNGGHRPLLSDITLEGFKMNFVCIITLVNLRQTSTQSLFNSELSEEALLTGVALLGSR